MSLFQVEEWWHVQAGENEEFDGRGMVIGNIDNDPSGAVKIAVGSLEGVLRVYFPRQAEFRLEDLIVEERLELPILQLAVGAFLPHALGSGQKEHLNGLAVLHPRKLVVYALGAVNDPGSKTASYFNLVKSYEHSLGVEGQHFTACNMAVGPFGGVHGRDLIAVQSMDGRLQVFEQQAHAFTRRLTGALLPGPLAYLSKTDSFITANSQFEVCSYRFTMLASTAMEDASGDEEHKGFVTGKKVQADWSVCIGEGALDIMVSRFCKNSSIFQPDIVVLGERSVFVLNEAGVLKMEKRLEVPASCAVAYTRNLNLDGNADNLMVATNHEPSQLLVFKEQQLVWVAQTTTVAIAIAVHSFGGVRGLVVQLDDKGSLSVSYLGTDPPTAAVVPTTESGLRDMTYEQIDEEHRKLLKVIRESQAEARVEPRDRVLLRVQVPKVLDRPEAEEQDRWEAKFNQGQVASEHMGEVIRATARVFVSYTGALAVSNVSLTISTPPCIAVSEPRVSIPTLRGASGTPVIVPLVFSACPSSQMPNSLTVHIAAAYEDDQGQPRTAHHSFALPLVLAAFLAQPVKQDKWKLTLETSRPPVPLVVLFDDLLAGPGMTEDLVRQVAGAAGSNALSFRYWCSGRRAEPLLATAMVSSTGRYRVQSNSLAATWLLISETLRRLHDHFEKVPGRRGSKEEPRVVAESKEASERLMVEYTDAVPLDGLMDAIDLHFERREELRAEQSVLNDKAHQFRVVEKRLLVRFKEKNPAPLAGLDVIMNEAYKQVLECADRVQRAQDALASASEELSCVVRLVNLLMRLRFGMDEESFEVLESHLSPEVRDMDEQGWEETTLASMTYLLRTSLAKTAKEPTLPQSLAPLTDTARVKKHIAIVCDRISKGARLAGSAEATGGESKGASVAKEIGAKD